MTTTSATAATAAPPAAEQTPIAQAIGEIHDRRVSVLSEYKKNPGLFSFGGPRDSFRREALSVQDIAQTVLERREALAFAGAIAGGVAVIPASIGTALAVGVSLGLAGTLAAIFALSLGAVLLIPAGFVAGIGIGECVGRIAKKVLAKKEERNIAKLAEIKDEASLTRHWKELKQGDRFFLLDKMAWEEKGFKGEYEKLQSAKVLSKEDTRYFEAATFSKGYKGERTLAEEDPGYKKFDYFVSQAISLNFLEKKTHEELFAIQTLYPYSPSINIALCHTTITDSAQTTRERFAQLPPTTVTYFYKLPPKERKELFSQLLSSFKEDKELKADLVKFFEDAPDLIQDLYPENTQKLLQILLKTGRNVAKQDSATQEVRLEDIKEIIHNIEEALKSKEA